MGKKNKKEKNPSKVGIGKLFLWQSRMVSVSVMTLPLKSWFASADLNDGALPVLAPGVKAMDPAYFTNFWTVPGYLGADPNGSAVRERICMDTKVKQTCTPGKKIQMMEGRVDTRNGVNDAWKKMISSSGSITDPGIGGGARRPAGGCDSRPEEEEELLIVVGPMFMSSSSLKNIERALADRIASEMGYAPYYLTKKFHRETGVKLSDYIKQARIEYAKILLLTTNKSVQEISDLLQFNNRNYFTKVFTDIAGMSPSAYRDRVV